MAVVFIWLKKVEYYIFTIASSYHHHLVVILTSRSSHYNPLTNQIDLFSQSHLHQISTQNLNLRIKKSYRIYYHNKTLRKETTKSNCLSPAHQSTRFPPIGQVMVMLTAQKQGGQKTYGFPFLKETIRQQVARAPRSLRELIAIATVRELQVRNPPNLVRTVIPEQSLRLVRNSRALNCDAERKLISSLIDIQTIL